MVEHRFCKPRVVGSSPTAGSRLAVGENPRQPSGRISTEFDRKRENNRLTKECGVYRFRIPLPAQKKSKI